MIKIRTKKRRILILGKLPPPYFGPAIATEIILNSSLREHYELLHLNTNTHRSLVTISAWNWANAFKTIWKYLSFFGKLIWHQPDLILIPISQGTVGFLKDAGYIWLCACMRRKILLHLRGSDFRNWLAQQPALLQKFVFATLKRARGVIVLGNNLRYLFADVFAEDRIFVVPNGADFQFPAPGEKNGRTKLLYLGNLQPTKGIEDVIHAIDAVKSSGVNSFQLDVVGAWRDPELKHRLTTLVHKRQLPIVFHPSAGKQEKLRRYAEADIFVFPPRAPEGHPWVIVEALAAGLPIISTRQGAIPESIDDRESGYLVEQQNPNELAKRIKILLANRELRTQMSLRAHQIYQERFTERKMIDNLQRCFQTVLRS